MIRRRTLAINPDCPQATANPPAPSRRPSHLQPTSLFSVSLDSLLARSLLRYLCFADLPATCDLQSHGLPSTGDHARASRFGRQTRSTVPARDNSRAVAGSCGGRRSLLTACARKTCADPEFNVPRLRVPGRLAGQGRIAPMAIVRGRPTSWGRPIDLEEVPNALRADPRRARSRLLPAKAALRQPQVHGPPGGGRRNEARTILCRRPNRPSRRSTITLRRFLRARPAAISRCAARWAMERKGRCSTEPARLRPARGGGVRRASPTWRKVSLSSRPRERLTSSLPSGQRPTSPSRAPFQGTAELNSE